MASSDEDVFLALVAIAIKKKQIKKKVNRRYWVHPYNRQQPIHGKFKVVEEMKQDPVMFQSYYRMTQPTFQLLCDLLKPCIQKKDTNCRECICPEERLLITLRYLATGLSFSGLAADFMRGETTIGKVVVETCSALWQNLKEECMPSPTEEHWKSEAEKFTSLWNMPNCIGSIDGKHIRIQCPKKSGSQYYNYLDYFSIVLLAVVNAEGLFSIIVVGDYGRNSDGGILKNSVLGEHLQSGTLNIPNGSMLPNDMEMYNFPYYFVGDEAFPLEKNIMRPYPKKGLNRQKFAFNARLSRARKTVECAFGRLSSKFRVFHTPIMCEVPKIIKIVQAACILHNFIYMHDRRCLNVSEDESFVLGHLENYPGRPATCPISNRDYLAEYLCKSENVLPFQFLNCPYD